MRSSARNDIRMLIFKPASAINKFIALNVVVFLLLNLIRLIEFIFRSPEGLFNEITAWIAVPAILSVLATRPWTVFTYMFVHQELFHLFFNMLWLYWIGQIFEEYLGYKKFVFVYIAGGIAGAVFFITLSNLIPAFHTLAPTIGASASVMAIITATATLLPEYTIGLMFLGNIKLRWLAIGYIVLDIILIPQGNIGGQLAHLGGALLGFLYINQLQTGSDWAAPFVSLFTKQEKGKLKVAYRSQVLVNAKENSREKIKDGSRQQVVDEILDKISKFGIGSLSEKEKQLLNKAGQDND